ncbi:MAG: alanine racemase [Thermodesulfobacteriota bacterium]
MERRPTVAVIDRSALRHNFAALREVAPPSVKVMAVVKANAYGHGAVEVARVLEAEGCDFFGVAICEEGATLREAGIKAPIVVLGGTYPNQSECVLHYNLTPVVFDIRTITDLNDAARGAGRVADIHLKVDTGMGRLGLLPHQVPPFLDKLNGLDNIHLAGVISHFATADEEERSYAEKQLASFLAVVETIRGRGYDPELIHTANSAAAVALPASHFNLIRPGIMLYGSYPGRQFSEKIDLRPVMAVKTVILQLKRVPEGFPVSYGRRYVTDRESLIATIPVGYGDGYSRSLSGSGELLVRGRRVGVTGTICMDLTMIDVTSIEGVSVGDEVVLLGRQGEEEIRVEEIAEKAGTISYEIFCNISARVPRVYK